MSRQFFTSSTADNSDEYLRDFRTRMERKLESKISALSSDDRSLID